MSNRIDTALELKGPEEESAWKQVKPLLEADKETGSRWSFWQSCLCPIALIAKNHITYSG